jgi:hypothetical protein
MEALDPKACDCPCHTDPAMYCEQCCDGGRGVWEEIDALRKNAVLRKRIEQRMDSLNNLLREDAHIMRLQFESGHPNLVAVSTCAERMASNANTVMHLENILLGFMVEVQK